MTNKQSKETKKVSQFNPFMFDFYSITVSTIPYLATTDVLNLLHLAIASAKKSEVKEAIEELIEIVNTTKRET